MPNDFELRWSWRTLAAMIYLFICMFDLVIMPVYREYNYTRIPVTKMVEISAQMKDPVAQIEALKVLKEDRTWTPITNDMFHLSFGAILGVSALPRNRRSGFLGLRRRPENDNTKGRL